MSKKACGLFRQFFAVCCAHSLCAVGAQLVHLQPEKYFVSGTRPDTKCFRLCFSLTRKILRSFFNSLRKTPESSGVFLTLFSDFLPITDFVDGINRNKGCRIHFTDIIHHCLYSCLAAMVMISFHTTFS